MICPLLISLYNIEALIIICRFESTLLLKYANPCRNLTFQRFARGGAVSRSPKGSDAQYIASPSQV